MDRQAKLNWMRELLDHMRLCHEQWQVADVRSERYLAESLRRDLDEFRRVCDTLTTGNSTRAVSRAA